MKAVSYDDVIKYVEASTQLAASIQNDATKGEKISTATILALSEYVVAAKSMETVLDYVERDKLKLQ